MNARDRLATLGAGLVLGATLVVPPGCGREDAGALGAQAPSDALRTDRRIVELLAGCERSAFYDRDLSDIGTLLLEKIERARPEALKRAKEELGILGTSAFPTLSNAFHAYYSDPIRSGFLENVVDALTFNASDQAHELLLEALRHAQESVRSKALDGLRRHARPGDFDVLAERLALETPEVRRQIVGALFTADRPRAEARLLDFIERGVERDLWPSAGPLLVQTESPATAARCNQLFGDLDPLLAAHLAGSAARFGHSAGLEHLRAELRAPEASRRLLAASILGATRLVDELGQALREDDSSTVRTVAAGAFRAVDLTE
ncbi:MAG: hypothetical protein HOP15_10250, partial [Planctomycetes bacterium]|nr:hypothetical protein [Planctomycetota bacterium]